MQSRKIEENVVENGGDLATITKTVMQQNIKNQIPLNKSLLPSKGLLYKNDITVKKLTTLDIKNLSTVTSDNIDGVMNGILARNVSGVQVNDILVGDKIWFKNQDALREVSTICFDLFCLNHPLRSPPSRSQIGRCPSGRPGSPRNCCNCALRLWQPSRAGSPPYTLVPSALRGSVCPPCRIR